jgi:hypothetical protein
MSKANDRQKTLQGFSPLCIRVINTFETPRIIFGFSFVDYLPLKTKLIKENTTITGNSDVNLNILATYKCYKEVSFSIFLK